MTSLGLNLDRLNGRRRRAAATVLWSIVSQSDRTDDEVIYILRCCIVNFNRASGAGSSQSSRPCGTQVAAPGQAPPKCPNCHIYHTCPDQPRSYRLPVNLHATSHMPMLDAAYHGACAANLVTAHAPRLERAGARRRAGGRQAFPQDSSPLLISESSAWAQASTRDAPRRYSRSWTRHARSTRGSVAQTSAGCARA